MNKDKNSLKISKSPYKENEFYDNKEINVEKEFNEKNSCECEENINIQSQTINSLTVRVENLETDLFVVKNQDIKKLQQKFKLARLSAVNGRQLKGKEVESYNDNALCSARMIDDLNSIKYPPNIKPQNPALNSNAEPGKFRYDRDFMMQFMRVCRERPKNLENLYDTSTEKPEKPEDNSTRRRKRRTNRQVQSQTIEEKMLTPTTDVFDKTGLDRLYNTLDKGARQVQELNVIQEKVAPIERSENQKVPVSALGILPKTTEDIIPTYIVIRDIREFLKKLTPEKFDFVSDQIIEYANRSRDEKDGRILRELTHLIIEGLKPQEICALYAQLCRKIMENIDPRIVDENVKNIEGNFIQGGALFRKYLLNCCQEGFEKGWDESNLVSEKSRKKAKRRVFQDLPGEEEMEVLCKLMITIGEELDHFKTNQLEKKLDYGKAKRLMDSYFNAMRNITNLPNLPDRIKSMLMSTIDLRNNAWKPLYSPNAAKQKEDAESPKTSSAGITEPVWPRGSSGHDHRSDKEMTSQESSASSGNDGWNVVSKSTSLKKNKEKAGDLTKFGSVGRIRVSGKVNLVPGGTFGILSKGAKGWSK
ncbi:armadillo-type protein [Rhizophagus irregularis DAOM 181602=DAOM 197198]|nr:armadillo-type protein [Rhizophagus irregularis DAOM 181602=DAOM 197198]